jgi:hypothetical protein
MYFLMDVPGVSLVAARTGPNLGDGFEKHSMPENMICRFSHRFQFI